MLFNIRVYGILIEDGKILVTDEYRMNMRMTKFPGGGLEFGEGTIDCIKREAREEFGQEIEVIDHFYTTDIFQVSAFNPNEQLISIYYRIRFTTPARFKISERLYDFTNVEGAQAFRWIPLGELSAEAMTFPIDKVVAEKLVRGKF